MEQSVKIKFATGVILVTLLGLLVLQAYLLWLNVQSEREWFDDIVDKTLLDIHHTVEDDKQLSGLLIYILESRENNQEPSPDSVRLAIAELEYRIDSISDRNGISLRFDFVIYSTESGEGELFSRDTKALADPENLESVKAGWRIREALGEGRYRIGLNYYNVYVIILRRMWITLLISAVLFLSLAGAIIYTLLNWKWQRALTVLRNDLVNNLTHELKTPIFSSSLLLNLLGEKTDKNDETGNLLSMLKAENDRLRERVDKVLDIAQIEHGNFLLNRESVNIHEMIRGAVRPFKYRVEKLGGDIRLGLEADDPIADADAFHLENVLYNLLDNALKYTDGPPEVKVSTRNSRGFVVITVEDRGEGIPKQHQALVFEKFYRVESSMVQSSRGIGLGLTYVRMIMEMHGGKVRLESSEGNGTKIALWLPG